jgi:putative PIN family toxin of toxin-antitoxin system
LIIVVDTNIIISGLLSSSSPSGTILKLILSKKIRLGIDNRIIEEYRDVLFRDKFRFDRESVEHILDEIIADGINIISEPINISLPDSDDIPFLEVAISGNIKILITGNNKHFPKDKYRQVKIYSPARFIAEYEKLLDD